MVICLNKALQSQMNKDREKMIIDMSFPEQINAGKSFVGSEDII